MASRFVKGDKVIVVAGSGKGKTGAIMEVIKDKDQDQVVKVVVSGINVATVHKKPSQNQPGKILKVEKPIHVSNVAHVEGGKPVKVKFKVDNNGKKTRVSRKTDKKVG